MPTPPPMLKDGENYAPKMVNFLNSFSQKTKKFTKDETAYFENLFLSFIDSCSLLGEKPFFRNNRFSKTLFESVFVAACTNAYSNKTMVCKKIDPTSFDTLKSDEKFISYLLSGSSSSDNIKGRISRAKEVIKFVEEN